MEEANHSSSHNNKYSKIISVYLIICILGLIITLPVFNALISKHDKEFSNSVCGLIAEKMNNSIVFITESVNGRAEVLSSNAIDDWHRLYRNLQKNLNTEGCNSIGLIDGTDRVFGRGNEQEEFEQWGFLAQAKRSRSLFVSPPYRQGSSGKMVFTIFAPIKQSGSKAGELFMTFDLELIQKMADSELLEDKMEIYLMNPFSNNYINCFGADKTMLGSWNNIRLFYDDIEQYGDKKYAQWLEEMRHGQERNVVYYKQDGVIYTEVFVDINVMEDWCVVVRIPKDALSNNLRIFNHTVIYVIVILILSLFGLFILSHRSADTENQKLEYLSLHDPLTHLINRRGFDEKYAVFVSSNLCENQKGALIFFDIDYFKQINDGFGHAMGDAVLVRFAEITKKIFGDEAILSRFGGDEFVLIVKQFEERREIEEKLEELQQSLEAIDILVNDKGEIHRVHFSAGIVEVTIASNDDIPTIDQLESKADNALYSIKKNGRNGYAWY